MEHFDELNAFDRPYTDKPKLFHKMYIFEIESICVADEIFGKNKKKQLEAENIS